MDIVKRRRLDIGEPESVTIMLVGCGGTGSFAALHLTRLALSMRLRPSLVFVDPDIVEAKNIGRQNFCAAEIGQAKAATVAARFGAAFGLAIEAVVAEFHPKMVGTYMPRWRHDGSSLMLIIGAVDNQAARADIHLAIENSIVEGGTHCDLWWLDAGNSENAGQVLIGNSLQPEPLLNRLGTCVGLPLPSVQEPALIATPELVEAEALSCAELLALEAQSLMINQAMAGWLGVYATRLLMSYDLDMMRTDISLRDGRVSSTPITGGLMVEARGSVPDAMPHPICNDCQVRLVRGQVNDEYHEGPETVVDVWFCPRCDWQVTDEELEARDMGAMGYAVEA